MKILVAAYQCDPTRGSEWGITWSWIKSYLDLGHEVHCVSSFWDDENRRRLETAAAEYPGRLSFELVPPPRWLSGWLDKKKMLPVYARYLIWQRSCLKAARRLEAEHDYDLLHHASWRSLQMATTLWRIDKPLLFGPVGGGQFAPKAFKTYFENGWRKEQVRGIISWLMVNLGSNYRNTLRRATRVLVTNPETREMVARSGVEAGYLVEGPFDNIDLPTSPPHREPSDELKLLWVGRMLPRKALPLVLESLALAKDVPFRLTILGGGEQEDRVEGWIDKHGLRDRVDYRGMVPYDEVQEAYRSHDAFLFTSLRDSAALQLREAMAFGLPVITLDLHGGAVIVPDDAGVKVPATTPAETAERLADAVRHVASSAELRERMGEAGWHKAHKALIPAIRDFLPSFLATLPTATNEPAAAEPVVSS